jgi:hypothetical protein
MTHSYRQAATEKSSVRSVLSATARSTHVIAYTGTAKIMPLVAVSATARSSSRP